MKVSVLGCGSAVPTQWHNPACQVLEHNGVLHMIDCGEGAQAMYRRMRLPFAGLRHVWISHLHGDHVLGLPGFISTLALLKFGGTLTLHMHEEGIRVLQPMIDYFCAERPFTLLWEPVEPGRRYVALEHKGLRVTAFPLEHRIDATGYRFDAVAPPRRLLADMLEFHKVPVAVRQRLREGDDFVAADGRVVPNALLTVAAPTPPSYAYASDTVASSAVADACAGVTLLYHDATYGDAEASKARPRGHSTAREAAQVAVDARAAALMLGHYSKRYTSVDHLAAEASTVFPGPVILANEGLTVDIDKLKPAARP